MLSRQNAEPTSHNSEGTDKAGPAMTILELAPYPAILGIEEIHQSAQNE